jgi:hypothetical protein
VAKTTKERGDVVCPICLLSESFCFTCRKLNAMRFSPNDAFGMSKSRYLVWLHPIVCSVCRRQRKSCWRLSLQKPMCPIRRKADQDRFPEWWEESAMEEITYEETCAEDEV